MYMCLKCNCFCKERTLLNMKISFLYIRELNSSWMDFGRFFFLNFNRFLQSCYINVSLNAHRLWDKFVFTWNTFLKKKPQKEHTHTLTLFHTKH